MIITRLMGGLGNQMFQYAIGRRLAIKNATILKLDDSHYSQLGPTDVVRTFDLDIFNICAAVAPDHDLMRLARRSRFQKVDTVLNRLLGPKATHFVERTYRFDPYVLTLPDETYLDGYFQTEKYFEGIEQTLRSDFTFKEEMSPNAGKVAQRISESNSVCVHVRRTDFLTISGFGVLDLNYFQRGADSISERVDKPTYFVFSDDIEWCRNNMQFRHEAVFVSDDFGAKKFRDDMRLMAMCRNYIISNSSFAWWAVWLNGTKDKIVIAPKIWVDNPDYPSDDLIPESWLRF